MNKEKTLYTRSEITQKLSIQSYILSLWEKEFGMATISSSDGQTLYTADNYELLEKIKVLIYEKGYSLEGAKKALNENRSTVPIRPASPLVFGLQKEQRMHFDPLFSQNLKNLHKQLLKLRALL